MSKIAIDVVLLPPDEIMDLAIEINKEKKEDQIRLTKENCFPHITLFMGAVDESSLLEIKEFLNQIKNKFAPLSLRINKINGEHSAFDIEITKELQQLHEMITKKIKQLAIDNPTTEMCYSPPPVSERTLYWLSSFKDKTSFKNYYPHITLAKEGIVERNLEISFIAKRLALCHLGNYCTCRKILFETELKEVKQNGTN